VGVADLKTKRRPHGGGNKVPSRRESTQKGGELPARSKMKTMSRRLEKVVARGEKGRGVGSFFAMLGKY